MPGKFTLEVTAGPIKGRTFTFEDHDTFIFGREEDCHARLAANDTTASRHHFFLEVNPPEARLQDIGSRNGTYVNGKKHGGRPAHMTPEAARNLDHPVIALKDGDKIEVGETTFSVRVDIPAACCQCGDPIPDKYRKVCEWKGGLFVCPECREKVEKEGYSTKLSEVVCSNCGKAVSGVGLTAGPFREHDYTCEACRAAAKADPGPVLKDMIEKSRRLGAQVAGSIDDYELSKELGRGGMGAVYLAKRKKDGKPVAIKVMLSEAVIVADENGDVIGYAYAAVEGYDYLALRGPAARRSFAGVLPVPRRATRGAVDAERNEAAQRLFRSMGFRRTMIEMTRELD